MNKVELECRVDQLTDEINFLRTLYETVQLSNVSHELPCALSIYSNIRLFDMNDTKITAS